MGVVFDNTRVFPSWNTMCCFVRCLFHFCREIMFMYKTGGLKGHDDLSCQETLIQVSLGPLYVFHLYFFVILIIIIITIFIIYLCVCFLLVFFSHWEVRSRPHCCHNPEHQGTGVRELEVPMNHNSTNRHAGFKNGFNYITLSYNYSFNLHATYM